MRECAAQPEINLKTEDLLNVLRVLGGSIRSIGFHPSTMSASAKNSKLCLHGVVRVCEQRPCVHVHGCALCSLPASKGSDSQHPRRLMVPH